MTDAEDTAGTVGAFGRVAGPVGRVWRESADGRIDAGPWTGLVVGPDDLQRRGGGRVRDRAATLGRPFDLLLVRGVGPGDLKVGWPMHALLRLRDERLARCFVVDAADALEAEWVAANAPVHGVVVAYGPDDMSARYRAFAAAQNERVAVVGRAFTGEDCALQRATPSLAATLLAPGLAPAAALADSEAERLWSAYAATHAEPPKLRGGHPPEE